MKELFPGYYKPTDDDVDLAWREGMLVLDTNVLLNLYRYTESTRQELLDVLTLQQDHLFMPYQVAKEFEVNRVNVLHSLTQEFDRLQEKIARATGSIEAALRELRDRHPTIDAEAITRSLRRFQDDVEAEIVMASGMHPARHGSDYLATDETRVMINALYRGRVGTPLSEEALRDVYRSGKRRYDLKIPPGFKDVDKSEPERYGDLVLWTEIVNFAKETGAPVILVTDDQKEDWQWRLHGETIGPRPELVSEMQEAAGVAFLMYSTKRFVESAVHRIGATASGQALSEIASIAKLSLPRLGAIAQYPGIAEEEETGRLAEIQLASEIAAGAPLSDAFGRFLDSQLEEGFSFNPELVLQIMQMASPRPGATRQESISSIVANVLAVQQRLDEQQELFEMMEFDDDDFDDDDLGDTDPQL